MVMVLYLLLFFSAVFLLLKKYISPNMYLLSFALVVTFAPIYGHGKNVLGEIPGMFFLFLFLYAVYSLEKSIRPSYRHYGIAGLCAGLFVATKPVFILIAPAIVGALLVQILFKGWSSVRYSRHAWFFPIAFLIPVIFWVVFQFSGDSIGNILSVYANPHKTAGIASIIKNAKIFVTESQPIYFLGAFVLWTLAVVLRLKRKIPLPLAELIAYVFSFLVFAAFMRMPQYYRYFFPAQLLAMLYIVSNAEMIIDFWFNRFAHKTKLLYGSLVLLFVFQTYGLFFTSWVAQAYDNTKTAKLDAYFSIATTTPIFLYHAPEVATFLKTKNYYQFFFAAPDLSYGTKSLDFLRNGGAGTVVVQTELINGKPELFARYREVDKVERYSILKPKQ